MKCISYANVTDDDTLRQDQATCIQRDALAALLKRQCGVVSASGPFLRLLDVRRSDERMLFGCIKGNGHVLCAMHELWFCRMPEVFAFLFSLEKPPSSYKKRHHKQV